MNDAADDAANAGNGRHGRSDGYGTRSSSDDATHADAPNAAGDAADGGESSDAPADDSVEPYATADGTAGSYDAADAEQS